MSLNGRVCIKKLEKLDNSSYQFGLYWIDGLKAKLILLGEGYEYTKSEAIYYSINVTSESMRAIHAGYVQQRGGDFLMTELEYQRILQFDLTAANK